MTAPLDQGRSVPMGKTSPEPISSGTQVDLKLDGARFQIQMLEQLTGEVSGSTAGVESCAVAAIDQTIQALSAALQQLNEMLTDPLPASRMSRRNLRDEFHAVQSDSSVIRDIEAEAHHDDGWLWWLEQKHAAAAFARLIASGDDGELRLLRDPINPDAGFEEGTVSAYLRESVERVEDLIQRVTRQMSDDAARYREARRKQSRRLI
jgi:hypothetical protein